MTDEPKRDDPEGEPRKDYGKKPLKDVEDWNRKAFPTEQKIPANMDMSPEVLKAPSWVPSLAYPPRSDNAVGGHGTDAESGLNHQENSSRG